MFFYLIMGQVEILRAIRLFLIDFDNSGKYESGGPGF